MCCRVYFTDEQRRRLDALAKREGKTLAQVVREAVDTFLVRTPPDLDVVLDESFGSMPDLEVSDRSELDRGYG